MRLFIAIELDSEIKQYLSSIEVPGRKVNAYHLTLNFLGEADPKPVVEALEKVEFKRFKINLSEMGVFPNEKRPRIVWVGVKPSEPVIDLHNKIALHVQDKFHPHITLSRLRRPEHVKFSDIEPLEIDVSSFALIKSTLTPTGPVHEVIKTFKNTS